MILIVAVLWACLASGQQAVTGSGGDAIGSGGSVSYTMGEPVITFVSAPSGNVTHGVQQPYPLLSTSLPPEGDPSPQVVIWPNPTTSGLSVSFGGTPTAGSMYMVLDASGRSVLSGKLDANTFIGTEHLASASYTLQLFYGRIPATYVFIKQ